MSYGISGVLSINNKPYEGLKPDTDIDFNAFAKMLSINNKPYEGLKPTWFALVLGQHGLSINNKPYEGLKQVPEKSS